MHGSIVCSLFITLICCLPFYARPSGIEFSVDFPATVELQIGDVVTIDYKNYFHNEAPVEPRITRVRSDLKWEEVLNDYLSERPQHKHLDGIILTLSLSSAFSLTSFFLSESSLDLVAEDDSGESTNGMLDTPLLIFTKDLFF